MRLLAFFLLCMAALLSQAATAQVPDSALNQRPPALAAAIFAEQPKLIEPKISPDGKKLLYSYHLKGKKLLVIQDLATGRVRSQAVPEKSEVAWYRWAGSDQVLVSIATITNWLGHDARLTRLLLIDAQGAIKFIGKQDQGLEGDDVLWVDPEGAALLLSIQRTIYDYPSVFRVELPTGSMKEIVRQRADVWEWFADNTGVVRLGTSYDNDRWTMVYRPAGGDSFRQILKTKYDDEDAIDEAYALLSGSDNGYVLSNKKSGRFALYKYDFVKRELGDLVYESPTNDIAAFDLTDDGKAVKAVWYTDDRDRVVWYDTALKTYQDEIDGALKNRTNWIMSRSRDDSRMIVFTSSSRDPGSYYLYEPAAGVMQRIARLNEKLPVSQLATTQYLQYTARDGLVVSAYLTLPVGREPKGLPLIMLPHGGPYDVRDTLGFDPEVQFLANRGYAVLQPNFRGSGGYGEQFYKAGEGQIGRKMQDDLDDGMDWLIKEGKVDAKRVCIVGASYGGYAALWGATRNPERYRCAASFAGVSDYRRQLTYNVRAMSSARFRRDWRRTVQGEEDFDLDTVSPLKQVDKLKVPVLLAHGDDDTRVLYKHSAIYAAALEKAGKPHEFYTYKGEGHGFSSTENQQSWLERLEAFLRKHNPPD